MYTTLRLGLVAAISAAHLALAQAPSLPPAPARESALATKPSTPACTPQNLVCDSFSLAGEGKSACKPEIWQKDCCTPVETKLNSWLVSGALSARSRQEALFALSKMGCGKESPLNLHKTGNRPDLTWSFFQRFNPNVSCDSKERHTRRFSLELVCQ
jgi:hypothetical protein